MSRYAEVVLGLPLRQTFTYAVPETYRARIRVGSRVLVPFHRQKLTGFIVGLRSRRRTKEYALKEILELLDDVPVFSPDFLSFTQKLSRTFFASWSEMLQASLPPAYLPKIRTKYYLSTEGKSKLEEGPLSGEEHQVLELLRKGSYTRRFIKSKYRQKNLSSVLLRLERKGFIRVEREEQKSPRRKDEIAADLPVQLEMDFSLDDKSHQVLEVISKRISENVFSPFCLHASQEKRIAVYFGLIRRILSSRKKVLFLVPEISSIQSLREALVKKLGKGTALLHSELTEKRWEVEWKRIKEGKAEVVVGPRSAILAPLEDIGLIIVDEEQDEAYYQRESPAYDARRGAWLRARQSSSILLYGSSIPSVETYHRAKNGGFLLSLEEKPVFKKVEIMENRPKSGVLAERLLRRIEERLKKKEPVLVFFNRRGYASFLICPRCRYVPRCGRCDVALRYHKKEDKLFCHYCGFSAPRNSVCPECGGRIVPSRSYGIEVVEEELQKRLPQYRIECFDRDVVKTKEIQNKTLDLFNEKKIDILLGTQLLARQERLLPVSCVVVLNPEILLTFPDFRASQKTFQSLSQMVKFVAREGNPELVIQTALPLHYSIRSAAFEDYAYFFSREIDFRRFLNYPPFFHVAEVLLSGGNLRALARESRYFFSRVKAQTEEVEIWGPALASVARVREKYRIQVVMKSKKKRALDRALCISLENVKSKKTVFLYD
jgi:primosomal protein N' (replication factor Y)